VGQRRWRLSRFQRDFIGVKIERRKRSKDVEIISIEKGGEVASVDSLIRIGGWEGVFGYV